MKNFSYLIILLFSITLVGCGDINEFTPTVQAPDASWKLSYFTSNSIIPYISTQSYPQNIKWSIDKASKMITIDQTIHVEKKASGWLQDVKTTNNDTRIEITYTQIDTVNTQVLGNYGALVFKHFINYSEIGRGNGASIPVKVRTVYRTPSVGSNTEDNYTISF